MFNGDINDLIGKPYASNGGDGVNSFDCASLVRKITGIDAHIIPSCEMNKTKEVMKIIKENKKHFQIIDEPKEMCIVAMSNLKRSHHVGVYIKGGVLHAIQDKGVVFSSIKDLESRGYKLEFGVFNV